MYKGTLAPFYPKHVIQPYDSILAPWPLLSVKVFSYSPKVQCDVSRLYTLGRNWFPLSFLPLRAWLPTCYGAEADLEWPQPPKCYNYRLYTILSGSSVCFLTLSTTLTTVASIKTVLESSKPHRSHMLSVPPSLPFLHPPCHSVECSKWQALSTSRKRCVARGCVCGFLEWIPRDDAASPEIMSELHV